MTCYHPGRLMTVCGNVNMLWSAPLQMGIAVSMLWLALGPCVCGGLAVMLLLIPLQVRVRVWVRVRARVRARVRVRVRVNPNPNPNLLIPLQVLTAPLESLHLPWLHLLRLHLLRLHLLRLHLLWLHLRSAPTAEPHQMPIPRRLPSP